MSWTQAKRVAQSLVGILLLVGCGGGSGKKAPVSGGEGGENPPVFGGANGGNSPLAGGASGLAYGGNGGGGSTTESAPVGGVLGLGGTYDFGTREPWASVADPPGATTFGPSTVAEACAEYTPPTQAVVVPTESDCAVVANQYETLPYRTNLFGCYMDGTPDQSCTMAADTQSADACGDPAGWRLMASSTAFWGGGFGFWVFDEDYSGWDGIGIWARLEQDTKTEFRLSMQDNTSKPVVDPATGYPSCYNAGSPTGQDWDHDGVANLSPPPQSLRCKGWSVTIAIDQQWRFFMLPWSVWQADSESLASAIDPKTLSVLSFQFPPCSDFTLQLGWVGAYRANPWGRP